MNPGKGATAVLLAVVAGSVDAVGLAETGRYSTHMTGTTTHAAMRLLDGELRLSLLGLLAVIAFLCGTIVTGVVLTRPEARSPRGTVAWLIGVETIAIAAGGLALRLLPTSAWPAMLVIACFAFAMGLQNATSTYLLMPFERTTHVTSNLTDFGSEFGMRWRGWLGLRSGRVLAVPDGETMISAGLPVVGFAAGAVFGTALATEVGSWSGLCAALLPACLSLSLAMFRSGSF